MDKGRKEIGEWLGAADINRLNYLEAHALSLRALRSDNRDFSSFMGGDLGADKTIIRWAVGGGESFDSPRAAIDDAIERGGKQK